MNRLLSWRTHVAPILGGALLGTLILLTHVSWKLPLAAYALGWFTKMLDARIDP